MKPLLILILSFCIACSSNTKRGVTNFTEYFSNIPIVKLPLKIQCGLCGDTLYSDSIIRKYGHVNQSYYGNPYHEVIGRIEHANNIYILYSIPGDICYPFIYTYNKQGDILDSLYLQISTCDADEKTELSTWSIINPDLSIEMTDTNKSFYIDTALGKRLLLSTNISKREYKLNVKGIPTLFWDTMKTIRYSGFFR
jgi:hypothetical protein